MHYIICRLCRLCRFYAMSYDSCATTYEYPTRRICMRRPKPGRPVWAPVAHEYEVNSKYPTLLDLHAHADCSERYPAQ